MSNTLIFLGGTSRPLRPRWLRACVSLLNYWRWFCICH